MTIRDILSETLLPVNGPCDATIEYDKAEGAYNARLGGKRMVWEKCDVMESTGSELSWGVI